MRDKIFSASVNHLLADAGCFLQFLCLVASKCGFEVFAPTRSVSNSPAHIKAYIDGTIERLGFAPDLYYLHRIDPSI